MTQPNYRERAEEIVNNYGDAYLHGYEAAMLQGHNIEYHTFDATTEAIDAILNLACDIAEDVIGYGDSQFHPYSASRSAHRTEQRQRLNAIKKEISE